jgi:GNAT superfamily N-acetyltransferase
MMTGEHNDIVYRRATTKDIELLVNSRIQFLNSFFNHPYDERTEILARNLRTYFSKKINSSEYFSWLAERNGTLVGVSGMVIWELPPKYNIENGKAGYILNMYTIPELRNKGICTALLRRLISEAKELGVNYLHLHASDLGLPVYRKAGFVEPNQVELALQI